MAKTIVAQQSGWNAQEGCWQEVEVYWEDGFMHDLVWEGEQCYIRRVDMSLWIETRCYERRRDDTLKLRHRYRERQRSYVLAERYCKMDLSRVWTEPSPLEPIREDWDVDGEFWR